MPLEIITILGLLKTLLSSINLFKKPIRLRILDREYFSSLTGELLSIIVYSYLFYALSTSDVFTKLNPSILQKQIENPRAAWFDFNENNMYFVIDFIDIYGKSKLIDPRYGSVSVSYFTYQRNNLSGMLQGSPEVYPMVLCSKTKAYSLSPELLAQYPYALCLPKPRFQIGGFFEDAFVKTMSLMVSVCRNASLTNNNCASQSEIDSFFHGLKIAYMITENLFSPDDYSHPINQRMATKYFSIDSNIRKYNHFFLYKVSISSDDHWLFSNRNVTESWIVGQETTEMDSGSDEQLFVFTFAASNKEVVISRRYQKIHETLATFGGSIHIFERLGTLILELVPYGGVYTYMVLNLFSFRRNMRDRKRTNRKNAVELWRSKPENEKDQNRSVYPRLQAKFERKHVNSMEGENLKEYCVMKKRKKRLRISIFDAMRNRGKRQELKEKINAVQKADKMVKKELEVLNIMEKMQEIEKLKLILLNSEQIKLFSLINKHEISFENKGRKEIENEPAEESFMSLVSYYENAKKKESVDDIDGRLIRLIDQDMRGYFGG